MFIRKQFVLSAAVAMSFAVPSVAVSAQSNSNPAAQTQPAKAAGKPIKFTIQNKSAVPVDLKSGEEQIHLAAGQSQQVKAPAGTKIVTTSDTASSQAGTVAVEVTDTMSGSTVNLR